MYEDQTYDVILNRMLNDLASDIDKREGSVAYDMLAPKAAELTQAYIALDQVLTYGFADTTYGDFLDRRAGEFGLTREPAYPAKGSITFTGTAEGEVIPAGTVVSTDDNVVFTTDADCTITSGTATANITAQTAGSSGNVIANQIINCSISGISCTNPQGTSSGSDTETDAALLVRYYAKVQTPATSGNKYDYYQWATTTPGVGNAKVLPVQNGNGTVQIYIVSSDNQPVSSQVLTDCTNNIENNRPIGATVTVESVANNVINVHCVVTLDSGFTSSEVLTGVTNALTNYFHSIIFVEGDVKYNKVGSVILGVSGVSDYSGLTLNGGTSNITLAVNEIPALGTVTIS